MGGDCIEEVRWWEKSCWLLGQAGADEEKAWGCRGIQGKTGQRHDWTLGTLKRQLQVSDWQDEQQSLSRVQEGASQRSLVDECSGPSAESLVAANHPTLCRSRVGLADHKTTLPTPRADCHATLTKYRFSCTVNVLFLRYGDCTLVSVLRFAVLVQILEWQTATPIDVAEAVLRPNQRANGTCSLFIKPHVQHFVVVSSSPALAHLLICTSLYSSSPKLVGQHKSSTSLCQGR